MIFPALSALLYLFSRLSTSQALPLPKVYARAAVRQNLSQTQVASTLLRPALFSRVAYCSSETVANWSCGAPCDALGPNQVLLTGGDGGSIPRFLVTHDKTTNAIIVAHQGTEKDKVLSVLNDLETALVEANATFFPATADTDIRVHSGFQSTFERTADQILQAVQSGLKSTGATKIIVTGHSLGGAVAVFDGIMFSQLLPDVPLEAHMFGLPRSGNQEWADFIDKNIGDNFSFVTNQNDPVPRLPPLFLDFQHASHEIHIDDVNAAGQAVKVQTCLGQEDLNCTAGKSLLDVSVNNHAGPYFNDIKFGKSQCPLG
ncbi:alpha/beta-hydrolase [Pluteus cervinus]|uniref:Alpha/beta-hydrolase n=1 Tax=Pluteus cervinus TaxID=181527 RepID=A0ACD3ALC9_9AGAR|nr:alpha/beta-hydrolase [Pluteus cervinus]